jgi:hypothetical protein
MLGVLATAASAFGGSAKPGAIAYSSGAHASWPVMILQVEANGVALLPSPQAQGAGWSDPAGDGVALIYTDAASQAATISVQATWVEMVPGRGWTAQVSVPVADLDITTTGTITADLITRFGQNGLLQIVLMDGTVLSQTCGTRSVSLDDDLRDRASGDQRLQILFDRATGTPPMSPCPTPPE